MPGPTCDTFQPIDGCGCCEIEAMCQSQLRGEKSFNRAVAPLPVPLPFPRSAKAYIRAIQTWKRRTDMQILPLLLIEGPTFMGWLFRRGSHLPGTVVPPRPDERNQEPIPRIFRTQESLTGIYVRQTFFCRHAAPQLINLAGRIRIAGLTCQRAQKNTPSMPKA